MSMLKGGGAGVLIKDRLTKAVESSLVKSINDKILNSSL
jgi:hypothetical protein